MSIHMQHIYYALPAVFWFSKESTWKPPSSAAVIMGIELTQSLDGDEAMSQGRSLLLSVFYMFAHLDACVHTHATEK